MRDIGRQVFVVLSTIAVIVVNALASTLPLNNLTMAEISDRFDVFFLPAGYAFSIWGLIYLALIAYSIYQVLPSQRDNPRLRQTGWLYVLSCVANIAWLFLWHYEYFALTIVAMVVGLFVLSRWAQGLPGLGWVLAAKAAIVLVFLAIVFFGLFSQEERQKVRGLVRDLYRRGG